jgi:hypothetical protein
VPAALYPRKILGTHSVKRLSQPQGHSAAGRIYLENVDVEGLTTPFQLREFFI